MGRRFAAQMGAPLTAQSIEIASLEIRQHRQNRDIARQRGPRGFRHRTLRCLPGFGFRAAHADHAARFVLRLGSRRPSTASVWTTRSALPAGAPEIRWTDSPAPIRSRVTAYRKAAEQGNADAQFNVGVMYANGRGVPQDYAQARDWYRKAAEQGNADAQFNVGVMYANGQGVPQDYGQALVWYRKAAEQGAAAAQGNLGVMYAKGEGVPRDDAQAYMWFNLAASRASDDGNTELRETAIEGRDEVAAKLTPAQVEEAQRMAREWMQSHPSTR